MATARKNAKSTGKKQQRKVTDLKSRKDVKGGEGQTIRIRMARTNDRGL